MNIELVSFLAVVLGVLLGNAILMFVFCGVLHLEHYTSKMKNREK